MVLKLNKSYLTEYGNCNYESASMHKLLKVDFFACNRIRYSSGDSYRSFTLTKELHQAEILRSDLREK